MLEAQTEMLSDYTNLLQQSGISDSWAYQRTNKWQYKFNGEASRVYKWQ